MVLGADLATIAVRHALSLIGAEVPTVTPGGGIAYMALTDTYLYEWKTSKGWTGCRRLIVTLADGTRHHADFQFK